MSNVMKMNLQSVKEFKENLFLLIPRFMMKGKYATTIFESKIIYAVLLEKKNLIMQNNWVDDNGFVFVRINIEQMLKETNFENKDLTKALLDLKKHELIYFEDSLKGDEVDIYFVPVDESLNLIYD